MTDFYRNRLCAVIGAAGFVGQHLTRQLLARGAHVRAIDNLSRGERENLPEKGTPNFQFLYGDISREGACRDFLKGADYVFNLAAHVAGVIYNQTHQAEMLEKNLLTQMTPLRIAHEYGVERYLSVSSVCVYAEGFNNPAVEENGFKDHPTEANEAYSLSKRIGEKLAIWYADAGLHTVRVRPTNVFGPGDYFDERAHVIPALIRKALEDDTIEVNGTGREVREFIYVDDVAAGMIAALELGGAGEVYNLGTSGWTATSIENLIQIIQRATDTTDKAVAFSEQWDSGDDVRCTDSSKAITDLGWGDWQKNLETGIERTVKWYKSL